MGTDTETFRNWGGGGGRGVTKLAILEEVGGRKKA